MRTTPTSVVASRTVGLGGVAPSAFGLSLLAAFGAASFALLGGLPLWVFALSALVPLAPVFALDVARTARSYGWLALLYVLTVTQVAHFFEHVSQMIEIHVLNLSGLAASGIFGALDIEWVHFMWNTWVFVSLLLLVSHYRASNPWLLLTLAFASWHQVEHTYIFGVYLTTGVAGTPGLLARGGAIFGGLPISRPDLHFFYNLIETTPLVLAFIDAVSSAARLPRIRHTGQIA